MNKTKTTVVKEWTDENGVKRRIIEIEEKEMKVSPWTITIHPREALACQGDDDGDTMGISADPDMLELFSHLIDKTTYHIEPQGQAITIPSDSAEGLEYIRDQRTGIVGLATVWRSRFLAIGDINKANAMSLVIQENIDCAKRRVLWSDWRAASHLNSWRTAEDGLHFKQAYENGGECPLEFPEEHYKNWCKQTIKQLISNDEIKPSALLGWRSPFKRISINDFHRTESAGYEGGNLVHHCHNYVHDAWNKVAADFNIKPICEFCQGTGYLHDQQECPNCVDSTTENIRDIIHSLLETKGYNIPKPTGDIKSYKENLAVKNGLVDFNRKLGQVLKEQRDEEYKNLQIDGLIENLWVELGKLTLTEIAHTWYWECLINTNVSLNNAFRAISFPKSPILEIMNMQQETESCPFLNEKRIKNIVEICVAASEPHEKLADLIYSSETHGKEIRDPEIDEPIHGYSCQICITKLETALINALRATHASKDRQFMRNVIPQLNNSLTAY